MSQLKYRISIGKVVNGEWKFDHYARSQELELLKVSPDGRVFNMVQSQDYEPPVRQVIDWYKANNTIYTLEWVDVSDTHRIEWGIKTYDKHGDPLDIYDGDIFVDWNTGADGVSTRPIIFETLTCASCVSYDEFPMIEILGNLNENPELLEAGK